MLGETAKLVTELDLKDGLTPGLARAQAGVAGFANKTNQHFAQIKRGTGQLAGGLVRVGAIATGAAIAGLAGAAKATAQFGDELNIINTIAQKTPEGLKKIGEGIQGLSADTGADLSDLTASYYDLLSAGVDVADAQGELEVAFKLGRGALASTAESVDFLTTALNAYGLKGKDATRVGDMFAQAVADGKVKLSEISSTFADVAPIASQYNIGLDEIAASYGLLTAKGVTAGAVTTQMNRAITELAKPKGPLAQLEERTGKSYIAIASKEGLVNALQQMRIDADKAGVSFISLFGRQEAYKYAVQTTGKNFKDYNREQQRIIDSNGTMEEQYGERQQGLAFQFQRLSANVKLAGIAIGEGFAPALGRAADRLVEFLKSNRGELVQFGKDIGKFLDGIDWKGLFNGAKTVLGIFGKVYDVIKLIPPEISLAVAGLLGVNKLSGGLLGDGILNIGKGLLGGATKGVLSKVPGLGKFVAQPVYVTNWNEAGLMGGGGVGGAAGGAMGKIGSAVRILGSVAIAAGSIYELGQEFGRFQDTVKTSQADLQVKADAAAQQTAEAALSNLQNMNRKLNDVQGLDRILADTFGGKQEADALENLSHAVANNGKLSAGQITDAIDVLKESQRQALARGNQKVADSIGKDIETLKTRLASASTKQTEAINRTRNTIASGDRTANAKLTTIANKDLSVKVNTTVNTGVTVRDLDTTTRTSARYGFVAS